jgi:hypothetical protein
MGLKHTVNHPASTNPPWGVVHAAILTMSATCFLLAAGCAPKPYVVGLKPEAPFAERESHVDTLRPTFRWERFPRAKDLEELGPHAGERIGTISYELRLWKVGKEFSGELEKPGAPGWIGIGGDYKYSWGHECRDTDPGELVYTKQGLLNPEHNLETPLQPNSLYFWTVRAHFTLNGKRRATEWSEQLPTFGFYPSLGFESLNDGCSYPATFHLIRTPKKASPAALRQH